MGGERNSLVTHSISAHPPLSRSLPTGVQGPPRAQRLPHLAALARLRQAQLPGGVLPEPRGCKVRHLHGRAGRCTGWLVHGQGTPATYMQYSTRAELVTYSYELPNRARGCPPQKAPFIASKGQGTVTLHSQVGNRRGSWTPKTLPHPHPHTDCAACARRPGCCSLRGTGESGRGRLGGRLVRVRLKLF